MSLCAVLGWLVFLIAILADGLSRNDSEDILGALFSLAVSGAFGAFWFLRTHHRFLVPGGIVFRTDAAWRRGQEVSLVTPADSPLYIDFRDGTVMVLDRSKVRSFTCDESTRWLLLAGWQSTARTPTLEEVKTFLGAGQDE